VSQPIFTSLDDYRQWPTPGGAFQPTRERPGRERGRLSVAGPATTDYSGGGSGHTSGTIEVKRVLYSVRHA
jgi:hypothetical protein